ncbi:nuclear transport factor 2 family protein [Plantibacter sp. VKM Ac-2885]|uniref:nuclear transport factor 2 family protein n=1 Tax=Plantibacter sp. VKM Ac-2885 TaxID=2783828 RepID=UPI00188D33B4|nr:nuclear transport factor 2 family protein [Plantibacter sp. VKM Ac-2885]MBF4514088.1 nuclear transport factor 2 family protein [Plantibacter sp. VKM Ac-2885]
MTEQTTALEERAVAYLRNLERGDFDAAISLCTDDATVWHSDGSGDQTLAENIAGMVKQAAAMKTMRYDITRQLSRPNEVLQQHVVTVEMTDGMRGTVHAATYFRFDGDLIERIEEYASFVSNG